MIYCDLRKKLKTYSKLAYQSFIEKTENEIKTNPKSFYKYINEKRKTDKLPSKMFYKNTESSDPENIANLFADFFCDIYDN